MRRIVAICAMLFLLSSCSQKAAFEELADGAVKEKSLENILLLDEKGARALVDSLNSTPLTVKSMEESPRQI